MRRVALFLLLTLPVTAAFAESPARNRKNANASQLGLRLPATTKSRARLQANLPFNPFLQKGNLGFRMTARPLLPLVPFSRLFKYDTSWNNPETRCYEFKKPLTRKVNFLFNFVRLDRYEPAMFR